MICTHLNVYKCVCCTHLDVYKITSDMYTDVYKPNGGSQYTTLRFQYISKNVLNPNLRTICLVYKNCRNTEDSCVWGHFRDFYRVWVALPSKSCFHQMSHSETLLCSQKDTFINTFSNRAAVLAKPSPAVGRGDTKKGTEKTPYGIKLVNVFAKLMVEIREKYPSRQL